MVPYGSGSLVGETKSGDLVVMDLGTGARRTYTPPRGCRAANLTGYRLAIACPTESINGNVAKGSELDVRTGETTPLPDVQGPPESTGAESSSYVGVGQY